MRKTACLSLLAVFSFFYANAQPPAKEPDGGGSYEAVNRLQDELTPEQRRRIIGELQANEKQLRQLGVLKPVNKSMAVSFQWPLVQAPGFHDRGFYGITNFVDHNPAVPNQLLDYNCGNRTYDLASGYNHKGIDIATWPFPWKKMYQNAVQIVAAAPGTIIARHDGNFDQNCAFCSGACFWNAVYVMHADGSVAWYGHMKTNSLTPKAVGQAVAAGEYLGIVGSSGNSTGPHLHLEVYADNSYTQLIDPYAGPCNSTTGTSWWALQQPYNLSTLLKVMTHGNPPASGNCPASENENARINFISGEWVYIGTFYRDQQVGQQAIHTMYRPNNTVYTSWTHHLVDNYSLSWWYQSINLPSTAATGIWRHEVAYNGQPLVVTYFGVNTTIYVFTGSGNWNNPASWGNELMPPDVLPPSQHIVINHAPGGECVLTQPQTISAGASIIVPKGMRLRTTGNLVIQ